MAAHPGARPGSSARRRLTAAALVAAPAVLMLGAPASAAPAVVVTPLAGACGLAVDVSGVADGPHVLVVRTTVLATGADVPVVEDEVEDEAVSDPAVSDDAVEAEPSADDAVEQEPTVPDPATPQEPSGQEPTEPSAAEPRLEAVLTVDGGAEADDAVLEVALHASAVPEDERWVRVSLELDGAVLSVADLELTACADPGDPSPTPTPSATPSGSPSATPSPSVSPAVDPSQSAPVTPSPSATVAPTPTVTPTPSPSVSPIPATSAGPSATPAPSTPAALTPASPTPAAPTAAPLAPVVAPTVRTLLGTGTSGYRLLALSTWATTPQTATVPVVAPVPDPVVAPLDGVPAGSLVSPGPHPSPLASLLPALPARGEPAQRRTLASDLPVSAAGDPLVDLAPAGFVLAASFGGLLMAGRRRGA